jgi:para-nitrobenzyl esterase
MKKTKQFFFFFLMLIFFCNLFAQENQPTTDIVGGKIRGTKNSDGSISIYKGIPFAAPPLAELRWKAPQPVQAWKGILDCTKFSASPMQAKPMPFSMWSEEFLIPAEPIGEDCLYLNVWSGNTSKKTKQPVLVWIYGGGFMSGGSACPIYDGEAFAKEGVVFVSINYRVGVFGFFAHPELKEASGNFGLLDQIAALQWVKKNIAAFGGDPNQVTIAGQSAGSMSVNALVASPLAAGLFNKAIAQSGGNFTRGNASKASMEAEGVKLSTSFGVKNLEELKKVDAETLLKKSNGMRGPYIDGHVLPEHILDIFQKEKQNKVALLVGWNQDEGLMMGSMKSAENLQKDFQKQHGSAAGNFMSFYPASTDEEAKQTQLDLSRDQIFGMPGYVWAGFQQQQNLPVYVYRFTRIVPAEGEYKKYKAFHTGEVPYAYNNLRFVKRPWEPADHVLANEMAGYWTNFIKTGNPNNGTSLKWPLFNTMEKQTMYFNAPNTVKTMEDGERLEFLFRSMTANK